MSDNLFKAPQLYAILNVTPDSFSDGGKYYTLEDTLKYCNQLIELGVEVIDIGAASTRPGATLISSWEEWQRLERVLPSVREIIGQRAKISLDSYNPRVVEKALPYIDIINDVSGLSDPEMIAIVRETKLPAVVMHSVTLPADPLITLSNVEDPIFFLQNWFKQRASELMDQGVDREQLIFDPGLGFGKQHKQSIYIAKNIAQLTNLGYPILVGHSRKGFLRYFNHENQMQLDINTAMMSLYLAQQGVQYVRVHNAKLHKQLVHGIKSFYEFSLT